MVFHLGAVMKDGYEKHSFFNQNKFDQSPIETLKTKMMEFYKKKGNSESKSEEFSVFITEKLKNIKSPLRILTNSYNIGDGIGDYNNQLDFNLWLAEIFNGANNVIISSTSFFEQPHKKGDLAKEELAKKITPDNLHSKIVLIENDNQLRDLQLDSGKMFYIPQTVFENMPATGVVPNVEKIDFFLNLATPMASQPPSYKLYQQMPQGCFIQSRTEYGEYRVRHYRLDYMGKAAYETPMGVRRYETGIKFYPLLEQLCQETNTLEKKAELLKQIENPAIKKAVGERNTADFINSHGLAFGYLQSKSSSMEFVLAMAAKFRDMKEGAVFIINLDHFKEILQEKTFLELLRTNGFNQIELIDSQANSQPIALKEGDTGKRLTLINFRGMSNDDKNKIIALSDAVGGSGNTSFSEMVSSGKFPFIQRISWVTNFCYSFVKELSEYTIDDPELTYDQMKGEYDPSVQNVHGLKKNIMQLSENDKLLCQYLLLNMELMSYDRLHNKYGLELKGKQHYELVMDLVSKEGNFEKIMEAWSRYCSHLKDKKNAYDDLLEMVVSAIVMKEFELMSQEQIDELLTWFPSGMLGSISLLHMAIEKQLDIDKKKYLLEYFVDHNLQLTSKIGYKSHTPLMLAAQYKEKELFQHILASENLLKKSETTTSINDTFAILSKHENQDDDFLTILFESNNKNVKDALSKHQSPLSVYRNT